MEKTADKSVSVIGAGIIGICCAWYLTERGFDVTVIDPAAAGTKTSFGNAGCISPSHVIPFSHPGIIKELPKWLFQKNSPLVIRWRHVVTMFPWLKVFLKSGSQKDLPQTINAISFLMSLAAADWKELLQKTAGQRYIQQQGVLKLFENCKSLHSHQWTLQLSQQYGYDWEELSGLKLQSFEPDLHVTDNMCAAYFPAWQHILDPQGLTQHIADKLNERGVLFLNDQVQAAGIRNGCTDIETISGKKLTTRYCVIAAGVWSNHLAQQLDYSVPMLPKRGYHAMLQQPNFQIHHPLLPVEDQFLITPMNNGIRIAGMAEFDQLDAAPDYRRADLLLRRTKKYFPKMTFDTVTQWMGQRPMLPDSLPIISRSPQHANLFYAFGHGHYGLTQGPTTGRLIADLIQNQDNVHDLTNYRFDRF